MFLLDIESVLLLRLNYNICDCFNQ